MERNNFSVASGFGSESGRQGIFATFSAFLEMIISEITMSRLNNANVLAHFSHAGVDDMADNTCHFGINNLFAANGVEDTHTRLYFPADVHQMRAVIKEVFYDPGLRFIFSTRSATPYILKENGSKIYDPNEGYKFKKDRDEVIREGRDGYVVSYGEMLYRSLDAVERLREYDIEVGLINKPTLNTIDENSMKALGNAPFVLVVEGQNKHTGLGSKLGTELLKREYYPIYDYMGVTKKGSGGLQEQIIHQGLDSDSIMARISYLARR